MTSHVSDPATARGSLPRLRKVIQITKRRRFNSFLSSTLLTLLLGSWAPYATAQGDPPPGSQIVTVQASRAGSAVTLGGTVIPFREVTLTAQIPGRVEFLAGQEGDSFKAKEILVAIDDDDLLAKRRAAVAQFNNAASAIVGDDEPGLVRPFPLNAPAIEAHPRAAEQAGDGIVATGYARPEGRPLHEVGPSAMGGMGGRKRCAPYLN